MVKDNTTRNRTGTQLQNKCIGVSCTYSSEMSYFTFRYKDGDASIVLRKDGSKWYMNGVKKNQKDVAIALAKIIAYGAQNRSRRNLYTCRMAKNQ